MENSKAFRFLAGPLPDNRVSGGKVLSSHTRHVVNPMADALRITVTALQNSKTAMGAYYRRIRANLGPPRLSQPQPTSWLA